MNIASPGAVNALLEKYNIAPLKRYGQNFLIDGNIGDMIAAAAAPEGACVLEIGPGLGALTQRLLERCKSVAAYEIDSGLVRVLKGEFEGESRLALFHKDFLKADIESDIPPVLTGDIYVAANLPYYATTDCIMKLLLSGLNIKTITVMVQKEFAQRLLATPGSEEYGALNAVVNALASTDVLFDVAPTCFFPKPHVGSSVVALKLRGVDREYAKRYLFTVNGLFAARRKTVKNNLRQALGLSNEEAEEVLKSAGVDESARAETLDIGKIQKISENIKKYIKKY